MRCAVEESSFYVTSSNSTMFDTVRRKILQSLGLNRTCKQFPTNDNNLHVLESVSGQFLQIHFHNSGKSLNQILRIKY